MACIAPAAGACGESLDVGLTLRTYTSDSEAALSTLAPAQPAQLRLAVLFVARAGAALCIYFSARLLSGTRPEARACGAPQLHERNGSACQ
jgi:hypothetical protein